MNEESREEISNGFMLVIFSILAILTVGYCVIEDIYYEKIKKRKETNKQKRIRKHGR